MTRFLSIRDAVKAHVKDGDVVYMAGFSHLLPFAFGHEIIRQKRRDLTLCRATPDLLYDQMIAAGCARRVVFSYAGNPGVGLLPAFRRAVEEGGIALEEYTHFEMVARLQAGAAGLPFWPLKSMDNDLSRRRGRPRVEDPFTGEAVPVVPALRPDVTILHAHVADPEGNVYARGILGETREAALAARKVLVSVEEIQPAHVLRPRYGELLLPGFRLTTVSVEPWGAHPSYVQGVYGRDNAFYAQWPAIARDPDRLEAWLATFVRSVADRKGYLSLLPKGHLERLKEGAATCAP